MRCAECSFFSHLNVERGECRESPPKVLPFSFQTPTGSEIGLKPMFPQVGIDCWCGKFVEALGALVVTE